MLFCPHFHLLPLLLCLCARNKTLKNFHWHLLIFLWAAQLKLHWYLEQCTFSDLGDWQPILRLNLWPSFWPHQENLPFTLLNTLPGLVLVMSYVQYLDYGYSFMDIEVYQNPSDCALQISAIYCTSSRPSYISKNIFLNWKKCLKPLWTTLGNVEGKLSPTSPPNQRSCPP